MMTASAGRTRRPKLLPEMDGIAKSFTQDRATLYILYYLDTAI